MVFLAYCHISKQSTSCSPKATPLGALKLSIQGGQWSLLMAGHVWNIILIKLHDLSWHYLRFPVLPPNPHEELSRH